MNKLSIYNIFVPYEKYMIMYNTLSNSIVCFTLSEYEIIAQLFENLSNLNEDYPALFAELKNAGFVVESDYDELKYIIFKNKISTFEGKKYHITINPTLDCNLKCWYCSTEYAKAFHSGRMPDNIVDAIKNHISHLIIKDNISSLHLDWFGGEPLMYYNEVIKPIADLALNLSVEHGMPLTQHVTTNSVYMTEAMMHDMARVGIKSFQITLDGGEEHHNMIKFKEDKSGTFYDIIKNINMIAEIIPNVSIILRINYDNKTLYDLNNIPDLISDNAKKHVLVDFQKVWQVNTNNEVRDQLEKMKHLFSKNGLRSGYWAYKPKTFNRCYSDKLHHYAINYDGRIFKCTARDYGDDKVIGRLNDNGSVMWNIKLLSKLFAYSTFENEKCLKCKFLPICMGPCIIKNYEARQENKEIPCLFDRAEYPLYSYVIEQAKYRNLID